MARSVFLAGDANWWRQAVVYQVYPRSFKDSNGDGLGDVAGITSKADYIKELGVDAIWLSPFYPSALADGGYDVADYRDVDPKLGSLADFDEMIAAYHDRGIRVFVDVVPNHSSNLHVWFQEALAAAPGSPERDRYIFRDGKGASGELPPNDWPSHFGPTGWTRTTNPDGTPGQWYLHLFAPEQPDFNWDNPEVIADFEKTMRFWSDRGVDGFRIDVAHALKKDMSEPYPKIKGYDLKYIPQDGSHHLFDRDDVMDVYRGWRKIFNSYDPPRVAVAEAWVPASRRSRYASSETLGQAFNFDLLAAEWSAKEFKKIIDFNVKLSKDSGSSSTWVLSNHDVVRHPSRYALPKKTNFDKWLMTNGTSPAPDNVMGLNRARAATMLLLALPGSTYLYQGEELGLREVADLPGDVLQDPIWLRDNMKRKGRDGCRVPLPWEREGSSFGFGSGGAHLPQPAWFGSMSVEAQEGDSSSTLALYRSALALRKELLSTENLTWGNSKGKVVHFVRDNGWHNVTNFGDKPVALPEGTVRLSSAPLVDGKLPGNATAWVTR
ncbi:MAG TPA: glycoside hydrolase family 13 protein [Microbacteriaceae bacterium]|nr:glycoside hydrolase family 13 protein [Microbacteriaceae bacterium]